MQIPCTGGTATHILEAIGTERLAFKVKLKQKYYNLYKVRNSVKFKTTYFLFISNSNILVDSINK